MLDPSLIPGGLYCYRIELKDESFANGDVRRYSMAPRESVTMGHVMLIKVVKS